jgi:hypothetical protein
MLVSRLSIGSDLLGGILVPSWQWVVVLMFFFTANSSTELAGVTGLISLVNQFSRALPVQTDKTGYCLEPYQNLYFFYRSCLQFFLLPKPNRADPWPLFFSISLLFCCIGFAMHFPKTWLVSCSCRRGKPSWS